MNSIEEGYQAFKYGLCSFAATYIAGIMHPLDLLKTRYQSINHIIIGHDGRGNSFNLVPRYEGVFQGLKQIHC